MALVDDKFSFNQALELDGENRKAALEAYFETQFGDKITSEQRADLRTQIQAIDEQVKTGKQDIDSREWGQNVSFSSGEAPQQVIYGLTRVGGIRSFINADLGDTGEFLHVFITYAGHQVSKVRNVYFDGELVDFADPTTPSGWATGAKWSNAVFFSQVSTGSPDQLSNYDTKGQSEALFPGLWTDNHRQRGHAGAYLILFYKAELFVNGFPEISFDIIGENRIFDPRSNTYSWTDNAALCLAHYLTDSKFGPRFSYQDLDLPSLIEAADICDQLVNLSGGGTEKRYTVNGMFEASSSNNHQRIINDLKQAMAGDCIYSGSKFYFTAGAWRAPVMSLNENNLVGSIDLKIKPSKSEIFNAVKGKYKSPSNSYEVTDYSPIVNSTYATQDGEVFYEEIDFPFTTSNSTAQRLAKIALEDHRQWITISSVFNFACYQLRPGDNVELSLARFGFVNKIFKVLSYDYRVREDSPIVDIGLVLKETAEGIYTWSAEETTIDLAPNTRLPDPSIVQAPTNLMLYSGTNELDIRSDGTVFSRIRLSWNLSTDVFVLSAGQHEIQYKKSSEATWQPAGLISGRDNSFYLLDVLDGASYDVRVRAVTAISVSAWAERFNYLVLGKLVNPTSPNNFIASLTANGILLSWDNIPDLDLSAYEIRLGNTFGSSQVIELIKGTSFTYKTLVAGTHTFRLRAKDTSNNFSNEKTLSVVIESPGLVRSLDSLSIFNMIRFDWDEPDQVNFPIAKYGIYKGTTFAGATKIGEVSATIYTHQESQSGEFTYWITAIDIHGNEGGAVSTFVNIQSLPFLELVYDQVANPSTATLTNMELEASGQIAGAINTSTTWAGLFSANSWTTWDNKIAAGFNTWGTPSHTTGQIKYAVDYGSILDSCGILASFDSVWATGSGTIATSLRWSADNISFTTATGNQALATNFRYLEVIIDVTPTNNTSLALINKVRVTLEVSKETETGVVACLSTDGTGTLITFTKDFIDIFENSVRLNHKGSSAFFPSYTITGNDVRVFLWNTSGARVSGDVGYLVEGIISR